MIDRDSDIATLMPVAARVAGQFVNRHGRMTYPEALSAATLGMLEAVDTKDRTNSVPLEGWACMKMRWQLGLDFRAQHAPRRKARSEYVSIDQLDPIKFAIEHKPRSTQAIREEIDAAINAAKPLYRPPARDYFYGPTQNVHDVAKRTGIPLMTCRRAVADVRNRLRRRLEIK